VARYPAEQMVAQPETLAPLTAELRHIASFGPASDSLSLVLRTPLLGHHPTLTPPVGRA